MSVFRNLLTQLFDKGGLPSEYQQVEWIAGTSTNSGTNYIDTGIKMQTGIEITFGVSWNQSGNPSYDRVAGFDKLNWIEAGANNATITLYQHGSYSSINSNRKEIKVTTTYWAVDNTTIQTYSTPTFGTSNIVLLTNTVGQWTGSGRFSIWDCVIKVDDNVLFNAIPCYRKSDNVIGMYDLVSETFFTNAGSGSFTKGGDV
jgi:hypothetical protein